MHDYLLLFGHRTERLNTNECLICWNVNFELIYAISVSVELSKYRLMEANNRGNAK